MTKNISHESTNKESTNNESTNNESTNLHMNYRLHIILFFLINVFSNSIFAQEEVIRLRLDEVIERAQQNAPEVRLAKARLDRSRMTYDNQLLALKPTLSLTARLPDYSSGIEPVTQEDGTQIFRRAPRLSSNFDAVISQNIAKTGGQVRLGTGLRQLLNFGTSRTTSYTSNPIYIDITQPLFGFNAFKWDKKILPIALEEAEREYSEQLADIAQQAVTFFFDLYIAQLNLESAKRDKENADELYELAQNRFSVGKIAEADVLQMELGVMQAETRRASAELNIQSSSNDLRFFLGIDVVDKIVLIVPQGVPQYLINANLGIEQARLNRKFTLTQDIQRIESERDIERIKKENGIDINIGASVGLSQQDERFPKSYTSLERQERIGIGINVPIYDWGRAKSQSQMAEADRDLLELSIEQENINFERNILLKIRQFDIIRSQLAIAERTNEVAEKRYDITKKRYTVGKVDVTELNVALREQISARQSFTQALRDFWAAHYELQRLTLYDFEKGESLVK